MADTLPSQNFFKANPDGTYTHNNEVVSKEDFETRRAASTKAINDLRNAPTAGLEDLEDFAAGAKARAAAKRKAAGKKAGGAVTSASSRADGCAIRGKTRA
jgi:hypothetical protein